MEENSVSSLFLTQHSTSHTDVKKQDAELKGSLSFLQFRK